MRKAVFLDKDGTVVEDVPFNTKPELMKFMPGVKEGLRDLAKAGYHLVLVTNQSGVALGRFREEDLQGVMVKMQEMFDEIDVPLAGFYYCPHHLAGCVEMYRVDCDCRKPKPGLLLKASRDLGLDLSRSWMVGDILHDIEAGKRAGARSILVDVGNETQWERSRWRIPDFEVRSFQEAAQCILKDPQTEDFLKGDSI